SALTNCRLAYAELRATWDQRDDILVPRRGFYVSPVGQYAGPVESVPLSNFSYWRISPEARGYLPLSHQFVLAARARYGFVERLGGEPLPGVARFFAGGANSVRTAGAQ